MPCAHALRTQLARILSQYLTGIRLSKFCASTRTYRSPEGSVPQIVEKGAGRGSRSRSKRRGGGQGPGETQKLPPHTGGRRRFLNFPHLFLFGLFYCLESVCASWCACVVCASQKSNYNKSDIDSDIKWGGRRRLQG